MDPQITQISQIGMTANEAHGEQQARIAPDAEYRVWD